MFHSCVSLPFPAKEEGKDEGKNNKIIKVEEEEEEEEFYLFYLYFYCQLTVHVVRGKVRCDS